MRAAVGVLALSVACSAGGPTDPARCDDELTDAFGAREDIRGAQRAPDGVGWCCPSHLPAITSDDYVGRGGYAADPCECAMRRTIVDGPPCWLEAFDDRGCEAVSIVFSRCRWHGPDSGPITYPDAGPHP